MRAFSRRLDAYGTLVKWVTSRLNSAMKVSATGATNRPMHRMTVAAVTPTTVRYSGRLWPAYERHRHRSIGRSPAARARNAEVIVMA